MLKYILSLEINSKKETLGNIEIKTPNEFILASNTEQIVNCHIFNDFLDDMFLLITEELANEFDKKIDNVYITFVDEREVFVCSIVLDKFKPKRDAYRMNIIDWQASGYTFKYADDNDSDLNDNNNGFKMA